jgi:hypothetical protein
MANPRMGLGSPMLPQLEARRYAIPARQNSTIVELMDFFQERALLLFGDLK